MLGFLNLHLEVRESFPILSGHYNLGINIFHLTYMGFPVKDITQVMDFNFLNLHLEVRE